MSCSHGNLRGNFSPLSDVWNKHSNLLPSNWSPFPEKAVSCANSCTCGECKTTNGTRENFSCDGCNYADKKNAYSKPGLTPYCGPLHLEKYTDCSIYSNQGSICQGRNLGPKHGQMVHMSRENYNDPTCCPQGYEKLSHTWSVQKPYTLG